MAHQFAETYFGARKEEHDAAIHVCSVLLKLSRGPRPQISPDDRIGDLVSTPDSLDKVEAIMGVDFAAEPEKQKLAQLTLDDLFWRSVLKDLLGSVSARCGWDPATLPYRSVRSVVLQKVRLQALAS